MRRLSLTLLSSDSDLLKEQQPPTTVVCCNSKEEREQFGKSELTQDGSDAFNLPPDESDTNLQLNADPYFYHTLSLAGSGGGGGGVGNRRNSTSNTSSRRHNYRGGTTSNYTQIIQLKLQLARQQESIEQLSSQLRACKVENEVLIAENKSLVNEVVGVHKRDDTSIEEDNNESATTYGATQITQRLERGLSRGTSFRTERTEQIITDNERLMKENEKLKTMNNILKKSFQNYVKKDSLQRKSDNAHNQTNTSQVQQQYQQHRRQTIAVPPSHDMTKSINVYDYLNKRRISNSTESTCFNSSADADNATEDSVNVKKVHNNDDVRLSSITIDESIRLPSDSTTVDDSFRTLKSGNMISRQLLGKEEEEEEEVNDFGEASRRLLEGSDCYGIYSNRPFS